MICPYCNKEADFMTTEEYYGVDYGTNIYVCRPCDATVGTHKRSKEPKGTLANKELRELRMEVHYLLDPLWKSGKMMRHNAYEVLQEIMGMNEDEAHIGKFNEEQCLKAIEGLKRYKAPVSRVIDHASFNSRGHFCNYVRKILTNKSVEYHRDTINPAIWFVWNNSKYMDDFLRKIKALEFDPNVEKPIRNFNRKLKAISSQYKDMPGYGKK